MKISLPRNTKQPIAELHVALANRLATSRFTCKIKSTGFRFINISLVRLKTAKPYCGNHAKACEQEQQGDCSAHAKRKFLEGADWVEFNDMVNDVLDAVGCNALAASSLVEIRQAKKRRTVYEATFSRGIRGMANFEWVWDMRGTPAHYQDRRGMSSPASTFPEGTPGIYESIGYHQVG